MKKKFIKYGSILLSGIIIGSCGTYLININNISLGKRLKCISTVEKFLDSENINLNDDKLNETELINGFIKSYDDKYMKFGQSNDDSLEEKIAKINSAPTALGCGFKVDFNNKNELFFSEIESDSYAERYGIKQGDKIISIDGEIFDGDVQFGRKLLGKEGTSFKLVIEQNNSEKEIDFERHSKTVEPFFIEMKGNTAYIKIDHFDCGTASLLEEKISNFKFTSVILDLRENRGGVESEGVGVADLFASDGIVTNYYYCGDIQNYHIKNESTDYKVPIIVLVNEKTASASEICTALLKQYANAQLVGTDTFGKGIFQATAVVAGGSLSYTAGYYTVGEWECYQGLGIKPDYEIQMDSELIGSDEDIQLQKAIEILS